MDVLGILKTHKKCVLLMHIFIYSRKNKANDYLIKSKYTSCGEKKNLCNARLCLLLRIVPNSLEFKSLVYSNITFFFLLLVLFVHERFLSIIYLSKVHKNLTVPEILHFVQDPGVSALALCCVRLIIVSRTFEVISEKDHIKAFNWV